jgi:hypothetical protein
MSRRPHILAMGTKRFECVYDCWQYGSGCVLECLSCDHWKRFGLMTWPQRVP